jgi:hypothetical protein
MRAMKLRVFVDSVPFFRPCRFFRFPVAPKAAVRLSGQCDSCGAMVCEDNPVHLFFDHKNGV